jgi:BirA family transcriptional regulator, biotin operon repressor / biotin---[acetyl-CoA-carboxylase] ligase
MIIGRDVRRFAACGSTMDEARALALAGSPEGTAVVAAEQTAGRGTRGRRWHSPPGLGLYVTVILRPPAPAASLVPLAIGVAVREAAAPDAPEVRLKWPNDLCWKGRKVAGVLCEGPAGVAGPHFILSGIGFNVGHAPEDFPPELAARSASLRMAAGRPVDKEALLGRLFAALETWYNTLTRGAGEEIIREFESGMNFARGQSVRFEAAGERVEGTYLGLDPSGALVCAAGGETRAYRSAEAGSLEPA